MRAAWLLVIAACGRLAFDPLHDAAGDGPGAVCAAAIGHDEDGDGFDDACDGCPHLYDREPVDGDGDGVDDACDPEPSSPVQRIEFFDGFGGGPRPEWVFPGSALPTFINADGRDSLHVDTLADYFFMTMPQLPGRDTYVLGARIGAASPTDARQLTLQPQNSGAPGAYYCELYTGSATGKLAFTYTTDGVIFTANVESPVTPLEAGAVTLTMHRDATDVRCATSWPPAPMIVAPVPAVTVMEMAVFARGIELDVDYFIQIRGD